MTAVETRLPRSSTSRLAIAWVAAAVLLIWLGLSVPTAGATSRFFDVPAGYPYEAAILDLAQRSIVSGYADGRFGPGDPVTRQQFAKMLVLSMRLAVGEADRCSFSDVPHSASVLYPYHFVAVAANNGLVAGYSATTFKPRDQITRAQVVTMVARAAVPILREPPGDWQGRVDSSDPTHGDNIRRAEYTGLLGGIDDLVDWDVQASATRAEVAQLLDNLLVMTAYMPPLSVINYGAKGDGVTNNTAVFERAIDACPPGSVVTIPVGTFVCRSTVNLKSGVTLQGAGIGQTVLTMPPHGELENLLEGVGISDVTIRDISIHSESPGEKVLAIHFWDYANVAIERVETVNCHTGIKVDTQGSGLTVRDFTSRGDRVSLFVGNLDTGYFSGLDLADSTAVSVYVAASNNHLRFEDVTIAEPASWAIQLWYDAGWTTPSRDITLTGLDIVADAPLAIGRGYTNVAVSDLNIISTRNECIRLWDPRDVVIDRFTCSGGPYMLGTSDDDSVPSAQRVTLRNGTYSGDVLVSPDARITGLVIQNVN